MSQIKKEYKQATYSLTKEIKDLIGRIADLKHIGKSSVIRLSILDFAKDLGINLKGEQNDR